MASWLGSGDDDLKENVIWENVKTVLIALAIALFIRTFLFQPFNIPSGSMIPTLKVGDYIFVSKYSYGYSQHSFIFDMVPFSGRVFGAEPERGDVAVFRNDKDQGKDYIKRVVGLPGDQIEVVQGVLKINGTPVTRVRLDDEQVYAPAAQEHMSVRQYRETLPNGVTFDTWDLCPSLNGGFPVSTTCARDTGDDRRPIIIPTGHYFMMGDNRDNSQDSRFPSRVGLVPADKLIGRADLVFFSTDGSAAIWEVWKWPFAIRWGRLFSSIE